MERPSESLKSFADRIARAAASDEAAQLIRLLRLSGLIADPGGDSAPPRPAPTAYVCDPSVPPTESQHVGVWERRTENGKTSFVRRLEMMDEWHFWANLARIEAKGPKRRVLFMGESVARGYLYDPDFTPAVALQMILDGHLGEGEVEVIDLARTNLGYEVRELALAALQLEPDIGIVFAGNNWGVSQPTFRDVAETDRAISLGGMAGLKRSCDEYLAVRSKSIVADIASAYKSRGIPLVWIVPEFNLAEWREPLTNAPHLPGDLNREWLELHERARQALSEGDHPTAEALAREMVVLDQGACVTGYYLLADCRRTANDLDGEREYLELARDATAWDSSMTYTPKPYRVTQEAIREVMREHDYQTVDLPALFGQYLNGELPGRRLFLDYCHLTTEGIQAAMGAAASCVLRSLKGLDLPWHALAGEHVAPSPETEAEASLMAAIHSAHRSQSYDVVRHFCSRALKSSPHIAGVMLNYIDLQTRNSAAPRMSEAEDQIFRLGSPLIHRYIFRINDKRLDKLLLKAIADVLEEAGVEAHEHLGRLRREEHSVRLRDIDLLDYFYCSSADQPQELEGLTYRAGSGRHYYRAFRPHSNFVFVGEAGCAVNFCLTCRLPQGAPRAGTISIELNGKHGAEFDIDARWSAWEIAVPGRDVIEGLNEVIVRWPVPEFRSDEALGKATRDLCQQRLPDFYPVFGEIHSFTASGAAEAAESPLEKGEVAVPQAVA
jgi:hypothetical protein